MAEKTDISLDLLVDGEKERLAVGLNDDERGTLERYVDFCGSLEDTIFVSGGIKPISVDMNETGDFNLSVTAPDRKEVSHALHELRPLVLQTEPTQFGRVRNIISERISHQRLRDYLKFLRRYYEFRPLDTDPTSPQAGFKFGVEFNTATEEGLQKYLNAFEFHRDSEKEAAILKSVGTPNKELLQQAILFSLMQRVGLILELSNLVTTITEKGHAFRSGYGWKPQLFIRRTPT